jgi:malate dehydrogenase (oxaloacetate-decarboxylating)(NADP+)
MSRRKDALHYHTMGRPGKIAIAPTKPLETQRDLSLAYSPGVAEPCLLIAEDAERVYDYTAKGNLVAVISNGTAVLGLGDIGPEASKPVMEGKGVLFKRFADIDVFDLELAQTDPDRFIDAVAALEPTFGGINLEDIKAPECFYIEEKLRERMKIPVFHDDQHGTSIIAGAALVNALHLVNKKIEEIRCVINGAGAAALACGLLLRSLGVQHILVCDSQGVIYEGRTRGMNPYKARFAVNTPLRTLEEAMRGADVFLGLSVKGAVTPQMLLDMAPRPIVMAMANPDPEISYPDAIATRADVIMATGRSDYPNQVNNVLGFPFIFRGALDVRATTINEEMKLAAVHALAALAREEVPEEVARAYDDGDDLRFGPRYIIPKPFDHRALMRVAPAVARAAMDSGVARRPITDWAAYNLRLERILGRDRALMRQIMRKAASDPRRLVFPEGEHPRIIRAASILVDEGIAAPTLLGDPALIRAVAAEHDIALDGVQLVDHLRDDRLEGYIDRLWALRQRRGVTRAEAARLMHARNTFGAMMVEQGDADGMVSGINHHYPETIRPALQIVGVAPGVRRVAGAYLVILPDGVKLFADTTVNINPDAEDLAEIALLTAQLARDLDLEPQVAMLSFSNFGSADAPESRKVAQAAALVRRRDPSLHIDGELQVGPALNPEQRARLYPFSHLHGEANVLIFPDLNSGNIAYKLMGTLARADLVGPILLGMRRPISVLERDCDTRQVVHMAALTVIRAQQCKV